VGRPLIGRKFFLGENTFCLFYKLVYGFRTWTKFEIGLTVYKMEVALTGHAQRKPSA
jgi:hypothetical protein